MSSAITRPMKGESAPDNLALLNYPLLATPKLDGIRALRVGGSILSASFKPIPNMFTVSTLLKILPEGSDGELFLKGATEMGQQTSAFMSAQGMPDFAYYMFDYDRDGELFVPYRVRMTRMKRFWENARLAKTVRALIDQHLFPLYPVVVNSAEELQAFVDKCIAEGYEGAIVRDPAGPYKCGRSTLKEGWLLKVKPFEDGEAEIVGFEEQLENTNEATLDAFGLMKRSSHKDGKIGKGTLGKFVVKRLSDNLEFRVGTGKGLTQALRQEIWDHRRAYRGKIIKYKHQKIGAKIAPRIAIFLGFRDSRDMTTY